MKKSRDVMKVLGLLAGECSAFEVGEYRVSRDSWARWIVCEIGNAFATHQHHDSLEGALKSAIGRHKRKLLEEMSK